MSFSERLLLRRVRRFIPRDATVVMVGLADGDQLGAWQPTPVVLTDESLLLISTVRATAIVTTVPFANLYSVDAHGEGRDRRLAIHYYDRERELERIVQLDFRRGRDVDLIEKLGDELERWKTAQ